MAESRKKPNTKKKSSSGRAGTGSRSSLNRSGKASSSTAGKRTKSVQSGNSTAGNRRTGASGSREYAGNPALNTEIFCWSLLAVSVLIFISLLGAGGRIGNALSGIFFGLMGTNAYAFPFLLFFLTIFVMVNRGNRRAYLQAAAWAGLFIVVCGLLELMIVGWHENHSIAEYYEVGLQYHAGGGAIGGALTMFFCPAIGIAGAYIFLILAAILFLALISQKALFVSASVKGRDALAGRKERSRARREENRVRREEKAELRRAELSRRRAEEDLQRKERLEEEKRRQAELERQKKRFVETSKLGGPGAAAEGPKDEGFPEEAEDSDGLSLSFFRSGRKKKDGLSVRTDLFGETKETSKHPAAGSVRFSKLGGDIPDEEQAPDTSFDGRIKKKVSAASVSAGKSRSVLPEEPASAGAAETAARPVSLKSQAEDEAAILSPDLVIHRGGTAEPSESIAEENDDILPGGVVTKKQIDEAGVSNTRRRAEEEKAVSGKGPASSGKAEGSGSMSASAAMKKTTATEAAQAADNVAKEIESKEEEEPLPYTFPSIELLNRPKKGADSLTDEDLRETAAKLQQILATFGVSAKVTNVSCGPSVTRYELQPEMGTKVSKITNLADDIKMNLAVTDIRIEAPIPGKAAVGIEVPNRTPSMVCLRELIDSDEFRKVHGKKLSYVVGKDIAGKIVVSDIAKMPHLLIAGATGSGKSVFINTMIMSIIYNADPSEVKMIMIDPKVVELSVYNGIPHLFIPVVTDPKKAAGALNWAVAEMTKRYQMFAEVGVRNLAGYNAKAETLQKAGVESAPKKMPQIVIIVDELADLMMVSGNEVEDAICRLAQLARACGIHLVIATQRPSVDVITGLIKANIPSRIAFAVSSGTDSRTILDRNGAERLLGNGDMLFAPQNYKNPVRIQGAYVSDEEIQEVVDAIKTDGDSEKSKEIMKARMEEVQKAASLSPGGGTADDVDELFADAGKFIISKDKASIGMLQRWLKIGFNRAARIMDQLSDAGVVGPDEGTKPRKVLMSEEQFEEYLENH